MTYAMTYAVTDAVTDTVAGAAYSTARRHGVITALLRPRTSPAVDR